MSVVLAFVSGYALTVTPLLKAGLPATAAMRLALAADTVSIAIMEIVDNGVMLLIPGAMNAALSDLLFWVSLALSLLVAGLAAFPANRWLMSRGRGHAVLHSLHASPGGVSPHHRH